MGVNPVEIAARSVFAADGWSWLGGAAARFSMAKSAT